MISTYIEYEPYVHTYIDYEKKKHVPATFGHKYDGGLGSSVYHTRAYPSIPDILGRSCDLNSFHKIYSCTDNIPIGSIVRIESLEYLGWKSFFQSHKVLLQEK